MGQRGSSAVEERAMDDILENETTNNQQQGLSLPPLNPIPTSDSIFLQQPSISEVRVRWNEPPCPTGWAGKSIISLKITQEMLPIKRIICSVQGKDQGWGNTGFSKISFLLLNHENILKSSIDLGITYHEERTLDLEIQAGHEFLQMIEEQDEIGIWAISAPYPGYECHANNAQLTVYASYNWRRRAAMMLFLYTSGYLTLKGQSQSAITEIESEYPSSHYEIVRDAVLANSDLTRTITKFL